MSQQQFEPTQPLGAADSPPRAGQARGFFGRHLRGEFSLARSYWVHMLLLQSVAAGVALALIPWISQHIRARYASVAALALIAGCLALWCWAAIGTWASAGKHAARGGRATWATLARCAIVLGAIRVCADGVGLAPAVAEHLRVIASDQIGRPTRLQVRADGQSILLSGGINDGSAEQLEAALRLAPSVKTVVLESEGGWVREGELLAGVIQRHHLDTYVEQHCESACTMAFLAGAQRAAAPSARIGFHRGRAVGSVGASGDLSQLRAFYERAGLPAAFIHRVMDTPNGRMWFPSQDLLLAAHVLTRRSLGGETAAMATAMPTRAAFDANMRKVEVFALFERRSPALYKSAMDLAWQKMQRGASDAEVIVTVRESLTPQLVKLLPLATDATLLAYHDVMIEELQALQARDTAACAELAFPSGHAMKAVGAIPQELGNREQALLVQVLREADASRRIQPTPSELQQIGRDAFARMNREQVRIFADPAVRQASTPILRIGARLLRERARDAADAAGAGAARHLWQRLTEISQHDPWTVVHRCKSCLTGTCRGVVFARAQAQIGARRESTTTEVSCPLCLNPACLSRPAPAY